MKDKTGKFYDKCDRPRATNGAEEKGVSTVRGFAGTYLAVRRDKIPSFEVTTHSPMVPWSIRHTAWVPTPYSVRRDTRMTPYEKIRGPKYRNGILPSSEQALARRPGSIVNQLLQPWATGLRLGRDTLSDEHLTGTAAGVMRSTGSPPSRRTSTMGASSVERNALHTMVATPLIFQAALVCRDQHTKSQQRLELCPDSSRLQQPEPHRTQSQRRS